MSDGKAVGYAFKPLPSGFLLFYGKLAFPPHVDSEIDLEMK
jgi:hypothetical protein